jgi:uncharacterized protein (TIGR03437 family)
MAFSGSAPTAMPVSVTVGAISAQVLYSGITSAALYQFNIVVPQTGSGDMPLVISGNGTQVEGQLIAVQ